MYKTFFKLKQNPFDLIPDPAFFIPTSKHDEALSTLYYGVRQHKGFIVVTGEVGTGKTLVLRCLLQLLQESSDIAYSYVINTRLSANDLLNYIVADFGLPTGDKSKTELWLSLTGFLANRGARGLTTALIIDEAHSLSEDILEEIRLLSNIETTKTKLLQILLIGQPELELKLDSVALRQLKQRVALRARLEELSLSETEQYIWRRLQIAGSESGYKQIFPAETIKTIYRYSKGAPRLINSICENSLISAYAKQSLAVTPEIVESIAEDFRLTNAPRADLPNLDVNKTEDSLTPLDIKNPLRKRTSVD